jgi:hypothetical protein
MKQQVTLTRQAIRTPRAVAVAGIIFSLLVTTSMVLFRLALPEDLRGTDVAAWLQGNMTTISLALTSVPSHSLVSTDLANMGVCDQRIHPDHQFAWWEG